MFQFKRPLRTATGEPPRVAIIGAGIGGISAAVRLKKAGITDFVVFDKLDGPGGVWWQTRYPGAAVDSPTHTYSFSFMRYPWSRSHSGRDELVTYFNETIDRFGIRSRFHFGEPVRRIAWDEARAEYQIETAVGTYSFHFVICAVGFLNVPKVPSWPGVADFDGEAFHSAEWQDVDLRDKVIAVVGTGSSSAQIVPEVAKTAKRVLVFQREPGWLHPKDVVDYSEAQRAKLTNPLRYKKERLRGYVEAIRKRDGGKLIIPGTRANTAQCDELRAYIAESFADRPDLEKVMTPDYPYYGKRPVRDSNFYPALKRPNVELVPWAVDRLNRRGIVAANGVEFPADVIVMATGFQTTAYLSQFELRGRDGLDIQEFWSGEPAAYLGITVPGFPNFFMVYGPNTNASLVHFFLELQGEYAVRAIRSTCRAGARAVEVRRDVYDRYNRWVQRRLHGTVWEQGNNYFKSASGRVVTQWPAGPLAYWLLAHLTNRLSSRLDKPGRDHRS